MATRSAHLVGSLPGADPDTAMAGALDVPGPYLRSLPDGETGERRNWIISIVEGLRDHPDLELKKQGDWLDYDRTPQLGVRRGQALYDASLDFGHRCAVADSWPRFQTASAAAGRPDLTFQEGVPGDFDLAMFTLGPVGALRHRRAFSEATLAEIRDVRAPAAGGGALRRRFAHESQDIGAQRGILSQVEDLLGRIVDVSAACGLGRRSEAAGLAVLERYADLCAA